MREEDSARVILAEARERTDELLQAWAERIKGMVPGRTGEALAYAMNTPGKRVRAALVLAAYRSVGGFSPAIAAVAAGLAPDGGLYVPQGLAQQPFFIKCRDDDGDFQGNTSVANGTHNVSQQPLV